MQHLLHHDLELLEGDLAVLVRIALTDQLPPHLVRVLMMHSTRGCLLVVDSSVGVPLR